MGIVVKVKGADFSAQASKFIAPITDGLQYWNFFGNSENLAKRNLVPGKPSSAVIGTLGYGENYIRPSGGSCVQTLVPETDDQTMIVVYAAETGMRYLFSNGNADRMGTSDGKQSRGCSIYTAGSMVAGRMTMNASMSYYDGAQGSTQQSQAGLYNIPSSGMALETFRTTSSYLSHTVAITGNDEVASSTSLADGQVRDKSSGKYRIGYGITDTDYKDGVSIYAVIMYSRYLSDAEVTTLKTWLRTFYAKKGITL